MQSPDLDFLLGMVKELDRELDRYLAGTSAPAEAVPHILGACQQMRTKDLSDAVKYWLQAIEHHAAEIANPRPRSGADSDFLASGSFLGIQLLKDIYYLRTQLMNVRSAIH
jgi:hypothetical protein